MDGASKFVKGDAIAGVIIIVVNIVGGFIIGVDPARACRSATALGTYTLLTVGDGLVSQIPALLISTATGIIVTRAGSDDTNLGQDIGSQVFSNPRALLHGGGVLMLLALVPGLPKVPLLRDGRRARRARRYTMLRKPPTRQGRRGRRAGRRAAQAAASASEPENVRQLLRVDPMELEIGYGLIPLADAEQGGNLLSRVTLIRRQMALDLGIVLPTIRIRDNLQLDPNTYVIKLRGVEVATRRGAGRTA